MATNSTSTYSNSDFNPYLLGRYLYSVVATYLEGKYNIDYKEEYPKNKVEQPTITSRIYRRTGKGTGPLFSRDEPTEQFGQLIHTYKQTHMVDIEFAVFGTSSNEADNLAWDLETLLVESEGIIQDEIEGFGMAFESQVGDSNFEWGKQDEVNVRTLRFRVRLPIRYRHILPQLKEIKYEFTTHKTFNWSPLLLRETTDVLYSIPIEDTTVSTQVIDIIAIRKKIVGEDNYFDLIKGVDYQVSLSTSGTVKIKWLDDVGTPPQVGEYFCVDYVTNQVFEQSTQRFSDSLPKVVEE